MIVLWERSDGMIFTRPGKRRYMAYRLVRSHFEPCIYNFCTDNIYNDNRTSAVRVKSRSTQHTCVCVQPVSERRRNNRSYDPSTQQLRGWRSQSAAAEAPLGRSVTFSAGVKSAPVVCEVRAYQPVPAPPPPHLNSSAAPRRRRRGVRRSVGGRRDGPPAVLGLHRPLAGRAIDPRPVSRAD